MALADSSDSHFPYGTEIGKIVDLIKEGKENIILDERYRNVTLVLGDTNSGRSNLVQWLVGDKAKSVSEMVPASTNEFVIRDHSRSSDSITKTVYPELVVNAQTDNAFYDCPWFSDTQNTSIDIAGTYFVKYVADCAQNIRLVFSYEHSALKDRWARSLFTYFLKHSTDIVRNVDKFDKSIALVVTKVESTVVGVDSNGKSVYESDESVIESIANFFISVKEHLKQESKKSNENYIKFIDVLLQRDGQAYSKIALFRQADMAGPLSEISLLQKDKVKVLEMVNQLELTPTEENDFGYSISESSKSYVTGDLYAHNNHLWDDSLVAAHTLAEYVPKFADNILNKINSFVTASESVDASLLEAQTLASKIKAAESELSVTDVTREMLVDRLNYIMNEFEIDIARDLVKRITHYSNGVNFLQTFIDLPRRTSSWEMPLVPLVSSLFMLNKRIQSDVNTVAETLANTVNLTVSEIAHEIWLTKLKQIQSMPIQKLSAQLDRDYAVMLNMATELNKANTDELLSTISKNVQLLGVESDLIKSVTLSISTRAKYLNYLQALSDHSLNTWSPNWIASFSQTAHSILNALKWYTFLNGLYSKLGKYQFQQDTSRYNVASLDDWGVGQQAKQGIQIDGKNFNQFLDKLSPFNIPGLEPIKAVQVAQWQLDELNQVLSLTLKHDKTKLDCTENGKLVVIGNYVKLSDLKPRLVDMCPSRIHSVNIFASNTVFIDSDLDGVGDKLKFTLMAPKWKVVGQRRINLNGSPGESPNPLKATNEVGKPGLPGGSSGSFLGVAQLIANSEDLTITANGGAGGAGQDGQDGQAGLNGEHAPVPNAQCSGFHNTKFKNKILFQRQVEQDFATGEYYQVKIYGTAGTGREVGGDGGAGGFGGKSGQIRVYNLAESTQEDIKTNRGNDGTNGLGGLGGYDGLHGNDIIASCEHWTSLVLDKWKMSEYETRKYNHSTRAESGQVGANRQGITEPEDASFILNPTDAIKDFRNYLNGANNRFTGLSTILDQIEKIIVTERLVAENLDQSTESLLNQIAKYAEALQPTENIDQFRNMLSNLSTMEKLYNLNSSPEPSLVYDVDSFLYYVQVIINILNKLRNQQQHFEHENVQQQLANLIVNINSDQFAGSTDPQILVVAKELESLIRSSFVLQQHDSVVTALKQLVFPYAQLYVDEAGFNRKSTDIEYLINSAVVSLSKMRSRVLKNRSSIWQVDQYVHRENFDSSSWVTRPFHVWTNVENRNAIAKLLSGESIVLNADIRLSDSDKDAIKFSLLEINLKAKNSKAQAEINAELRNFLVSATHLGNSNYHYGDNYYQINNIPLNIEYSFAKDSNGQPTASNEVYRKIKSGDLMASPYAMWQIQLSKMNEMVSFDRLAKYREAVGLELVGQGIYTESERARSDYLQVERYYSEYIDDTRAQINVAERQQLRKAKVMKVNSLYRSEVRVPEQVSNSTGALSYISRLSETVSNLFGSNSTVNTHHISHPRFDYTRQHNDTNNATNLTRSSKSVDVQGNLLMSQLLVGLIAGKNGTLSSESYMSPEQARAVQIESLAQRIVPVLSQSSPTRSSQLYNANNQWHRDWNDTSREHN